MKNYQELRIWKEGIEIVKGVYSITKRLPKEERYGLVSQMTRAAVSIPANIAEGSSRKSDIDYARFLQIALGSAFELQTYFEIIKELDWKIISALTEIEDQLEKEIKMIQAFMKTLRNSR